MSTKYVGYSQSLPYWNPVSEIIIWFQLLRNNIVTVGVAPTVAVIAILQSHHEWNLGSVGVCFIWGALSLWFVDVPNQILGVEEDRINKPWRPLAAGLVTPTGMWVRWVLGTLLYLELSWWFIRVMPWTIGWMALMAVYIFTPWLHRTWFGKNLIFVSGTFVNEFGGALAIAGQPLDARTWMFLGWTSFWGSVVYLIQDFRDAEGDLKMQRRTLPVLLGNATATKRVAASTFLVAVVNGLFYWRFGVPAWWSAFHALICVALATGLRSATSQRQFYNLYHFVEWYLVFLGASFYWIA